MQTIIALDTETGGFNPQTQALLSIGVVVIDPSAESVQRVGTTVLPADGLWVHPAAAEVNGYTPEGWAKTGIPEAEALARFIKVEAKHPESIWVAHNAGFDVRFMRAAADRCGMELPILSDVRCSQRLLRDWRRASAQAGGATLADLAQLCGHWDQQDCKDKAHDAVHDAEACARGYLWLREQEELRARIGA